MTLNCIIIDDEPLAAQLLASYAERTPVINLVGTYNSAVAAIKDIKEKKIDLLFLDIQMPDLSGLEFATLIPKSTKIVFTTAFSQYAIDGYKVGALDYLLKPISYEDFIREVDKAEKIFTEQERQVVYDRDRFIYVKSEYKLLQIRLDDILFIEGLKDYVKIYLEGNQKYVMSLMNMKKMEENLPKPEFMRTHRSYIVHMTKVKLVDRFRIVFGSSYIPISDSYKDEVQRYLDLHTLA